MKQTEQFKPKNTMSHVKTASNGTDLSTLALSKPA
jgi:hypothetical protein